MDALQWKNSTTTDCARKNNLIAINSLKIQRVLRWGKNVDLLMTDNWMLRSPDERNDSGLYSGISRVSPQIPYEIMNYRSHYNVAIHRNNQLQRQRNSESYQRCVCANIPWLWTKENGSWNNWEFKARWKIWGHIWHNGTTLRLSEPTGRIRKQMAERCKLRCDG